MPISLNSGREQNSNTQHIADAEVRRARIRQLNDALRRTGQGGHMMITAGIEKLPAAQQAAIAAAVASFDSFDEYNDPYSEHDLGTLEVHGVRVLWKIEYFDRALTKHSPDPADAAVTLRSLIVMLASEY